MYHSYGSQFSSGVPHIAEQTPGAQHIPGARRSSGSSFSHSVPISPSAQCRGTATSSTAAAQPSNPMGQHKGEQRAPIPPEPQCCFWGSTPAPRTPLVSCQEPALCSAQLHPGSVLSQWPWLPPSPHPHLFICLELQEIVIFKLLPPCLCCGTVGWNVQEAQQGTGCNCITVGFLWKSVKLSPALSNYLFLPVLCALPKGAVPNWRDHRKEGGKTLHEASFPFQAAQDRTGIGRGV